MIGFRQRGEVMPNDAAALLKVLRRSHDLVARSEDSAWSCMDVKEILDSLRKSIMQLEQSRAIDVNELRFLFVATGPLQETSLSNEWANEFLLLAKRFDEIVGESPS